MPSRLTVSLYMCSPIFFLFHIFSEFFSLKYNTVHITVLSYNRIYLFSTLKPDVIDLFRQIR